MKHQKIKTKMKIYSLVITLFIVLSSFSQTHKGAIAPVKENGIQKIILPSNVRSATKENFNFLRIKDSQKEDVPYTLIYNTNKVFSTFSPVKIISKKVIADSITAILLENKNLNIWDHITLRIANTKITKTYTVFGSNDRKNWFGLVSNKTLDNLNSKTKTSVEKTINLPLNSYQFLRIDFNDKKALPINVLGIGIYKNKFFTQTPVKLAFFQQNITNLKDKKVTQIKFRAQSPHKINTISFNVNTNFFLRKASVIVERERSVKKRIESYREELFHFQLNSNNSNSFNIHNLNEKEFIIEIENEDNPPLDIESISFFQHPIYLVTNLEQNKKYAIVIDTTLTKPKYDIGNFISKQTDTIRETSISNFNKIKENTRSPKSIPFWQTKLFMWSCIVIGGIFVIYFSLKLLKDINFN